MPDTYLDLVTDFMRETALSGGTPPDDVETATGDQAKAVYWIRVADLQIQREWMNWDFLWRTATYGLSQGSNVVPPATETDGTSTYNIVNFVKRKSLAILTPGTQIGQYTDAHFPCFQDWNNSNFPQMYDYIAQDSSDTPGFWSFKPNKIIMLSEPIESAGLFAKYDFYRVPKRMRVNAAVSLVPDDFKRLIVVLAKIMYAEHEDAPEVSAGSHEEYEFLLSEMESSHLPDQGFNRESHSDADLVVSPE